jgi:hypothetical protein
VGGAGFTVIVTACVAVPPAPVAVSVYVVVLRGDTTADPEAAGALVPTAGAIEIEVAFVVCQVRVVDRPAVIVVALAETVAVTAAFTVTVTLCVVAPPAPVTVIV